jgi:uncharacterized lipoprotein
MQNKIKSTLLCTTFLLYACANYNSNGNYSSQGGNQKVEDLVVPPGLNSVDNNTEYKMPDDKIKYQINDIKSMKIIQAGSQRWLQIKNNNVNALWPIMLDYLGKQGLTIRYQNKSLGIIQTNWATMNNIVPQTGIRGLFEYLGLGDMYSLSSQYNFKITLWQDSSDVNIFVTNLQMNQVYPDCKIPNNSSASYSSSSSNQQITKWMMVPSNPQLELNFLLQFIGFSSLDKNILKQIKVNVEESSKIEYNKYIINNRILIKDSFDRLWWRSVIALERAGLGIADKNRESGEFYVYPLASSVSIPEEGIWQKLFGSKGINLKLPEAQYLIKLKSESSITSITIKSINSNDKDDSQKYLDALAKELIINKVYE